MVGLRIRTNTRREMDREITIELSNRQTSHRFDEAQLTSAVRLVIEDQHLAAASVSLAVVDEPAMHALNRRYLDHDFPTDVLSFVLERQADYLEGEIIVSADAAADSAARYGWSTADEMMLYVIHGALHLAGYDDSTAEQRARMRDLECGYLERFNLKPRYEEDQRPAAGAAVLPHSSSDTIKGERIP